MKSTFFSHCRIALMLMSSISLFVTSLTTFAKPALNEQGQRIVIVDADTANEVDDLFAVTRALIEPTWHVSALNATQWEASHWSVDKTMEESHRLNQMIAGYLKSDVLTRRGGGDRMYDWGDQAQHSAAAYEIIKQANQVKSGDKLTVIALGALTNVASAIFIDPSIEDKISLFWLGSTINFDTKKVGHDDFNCMMDIHAYYKIMNSNIDLHIMPLNVASKMKFEYNATNQLLRSKHPLANFLMERWDHHIDPLRYKRTVWDLAVITPLIHPDMVQTQVITLKGEFEGKKVTYFTELNDKAIREDFHAELDKALTNL